MAKNRYNKESYKHLHPIVQLNEDERITDIEMEYQRSINEAEAFKAEYLRRIEDAEKKKDKAICDVVASDLVEFDDDCVLLADDDAESGIDDWPAMFYYDYASKLTDEDIEKLLPIANKYIFVETLTVDALKAFLDGCRNTYKIKSIRFFALLMSLLAQGGLIHNQWQKFAEENGNIISKREKIVNCSDLSSALNKMNTYKSETTQSERILIIKNKITNAVDAIKR